MREMKIPSKIIVMDTPWTVVFKKRIGKGGLAGLCDPAKHEISILRGMSDHETLSTFIHEVLHAIEYGLQKTIGHGLINKIEAPLSSVLQQVFEANRAK